MSDQTFVTGSTSETTGSLTGSVTVDNLGGTRDAIAEELFRQRQLGYVSGAGPIPDTHINLSGSIEAARAEHDEHPAEAPTTTELVEAADTILTGSIHGGMTADELTKDSIAKALGITGPVVGDLPAAKGPTTLATPVFHPAHDDHAIFEEPHVPHPAPKPVPRRAHPVVETVVTGSK